jgi:hypothetical protein
MWQRIKLNQKTQTLFVLLAIVIPFTLSLVQILSINLTLWYDNSRDLLSAWDNLTKVTLIGPTSGIPGIFYGPYWIWLLSLGLFFSKNPLIVTIITATIPYFILFPLIWFNLKKFFDITSLTTCWLLFIFSSGMSYATRLWNLYPAPLITLAVIYFIAQADFNDLTKKQAGFGLVIGFLTGLLINFDISFGIAFLAGVIIFLIADSGISFFQSIKKLKKKIMTTRLSILGFIILGFGIAFLPTVLFEIRHGFHQTQTLLHTLSKYGAVVTVTGMNKSQILITFLKTFGALLYLPAFFAGILLFLLIGTCSYFIYKQKIKLGKSDKRILLLISSLFLGNLFIYLTAKNPVWDYHFVGVDILFLLLLTFFSTKLSLFRKGLLIYAIITVVISVGTYIINFHKQASYFEQQENVVKIITHDAGSQKYIVFAYNSSIYSYDFSFLFRWIANKDVPYDPGLIKQSGKLIYLIVPMKIDSRVQDFIHFRSQPAKYKEVKIWKTESAFEVIKYVKR